MQLLSAATISEAARDVVWRDAAKEDSISPELANNESLKNYLLFTHYSDIFQDISNTDVVYNRYFWFLRFVADRKLHHGSDAGLDQQAFRIIESADCELDWANIKQIEERVSAGSES